MNGGNPYYKGRHHRAKGLLPFLPERSAFRGEYSEVRE